MRKRPKQRHVEENFINKAQADKADKNAENINDLHTYVKHSKWPIIDHEITTSFAQGSNLRKPFTLPLKEYEWNSVDRHTKALGIQKSEWIRYAMFKLMSEEQRYFSKNKEDE